MGLICEKEGMARSAGRIFGLLLVGGRACSLDELAEKLQASKAGVSTNCRMREDPWEHMMRVAQSRWREMVKVFGEVEPALPPQLSEGKRRLREAGEFHGLLIRQVDALMDTWRAMRAAAAADPAEHAA